MFIKSAEARITYFVGVAPLIPEPDVRGCAEANEPTMTDVDTYQFAEFDHGLMNEQNIF